VPTEPDKPDEQPKEPAAPQQIAEQQEPPPFSEEYHRAHKNYGFWSALLLAWELIGIRIPVGENSSATDTMLELEFFKVRIQILSPQAAPIVLLALIGYFGYRYTVEWKQSNQRRSHLRISMIDFGVAHGIATLGVLVYTYQRIKGIQIVEFVPYIALYVLCSIASFSFGRISTYLILGKNLLHHKLSTPDIHLQYPLSIIFTIAMFLLLPNLDSLIIMPLALLAAYLYVTKKLVGYYYTKLLTVQRFIKEFKHELLDTYSSFRIERLQLLVNELHGFHHSWSEDEKLLLLQIALRELVLRGMLTEDHEVPGTFHLDREALKKHIPFPNIFQRIAFIKKWVSTTHLP